MTPHAADPAPATPGRPSALRQLPVGSLRPEGWLRDQLLRQASGAAGHLDEFWPDVADSQWIGGAAEGWERAPYWLDGLVPLAHLLGDERLLAKVDRWVGHLLATQDADGWMGPRTADPSEHHLDGLAEVDVWPRIIVLKALLQQHSATRDERVLVAAHALAHKIHEVLADDPLHEWGKVRWADLVWCTEELRALTGDERLAAVAARAYEQGFDWLGYAEDPPYPEPVTEARLAAWAEEAGGAWMNEHFLVTHGVNVAMGLKSMPVLERWGAHCAGDGRERAAFRSLLTWLDTHHGTATGMFAADEHLAGRMPSQGTETCAVVEMLYSLEIALAVWGPDEDVVARWERIALNALPAASRVDEWGHQYVQQVNQVVVHSTEDRVYMNNGPDSNTFGLEPQFGCCTANRHQGWPKFVAHAWMRAADGGLTVLSYVPVAYEDDMVRLRVSGEFPFGDEVRIDAQVREATTLHLRVPAWAARPTLAVDGAPVEVVAGRVRTVRLEPGAHVLVLGLAAVVVAEPRPADAVVLSRGPLLLSLAVDEDWRRTGGPDIAPTWEAHPRSSWAFALDGRAAADAVVLHREVAGPVFDAAATPLEVRVTARPVVGWGLDRGAAASVPVRPRTAEGETRRFVPYGAARLRVTELPSV